VRRLCTEISASNDPQKVDELLDLLEGVLNNDREELRVRLNFLREKYASIFGPPTPEAASSGD
jgi:hypothetical protein